MYGNLRTRLARPSRRELAKIAVFAVLLAVILWQFLTADYTTRHGVGFELIGGVLFFGATVVGIALWFLTWRKRAVVLLIVAVGYIGSYSTLSALGGYYISRSGKLRYNNGAGLAMSDCYVWHAKGTYWEPFVDVSHVSTSHGTFFGYFYLPLVQCDRKWVHPTIWLFSEG